VCRSSSQSYHRRRQRRPAAQHSYAANSVVSIEVEACECEMWEKPCAWGEASGLAPVPDPLPQSTKMPCAGQEACLHPLIEDFWLLTWPC
jgi:hypothetical protein